MTGNVRFEKNGLLYVDYKDITVTVKNPYDYTPKTVNVIKIDDDYYVRGFEPKKKKEVDE